MLGHLQTDPENNKKQEINRCSILISGTDMTGKTLLSTGLKLILEKEGYEVEKKQYSLMNNIFLSSARKMMEQFENTNPLPEEEKKTREIIGGLMLVSSLYDAANCELKRDPESRKILIIDSYIQRSIAYHMAHDNSSSIFRLYKTLQDKLPTFDVNIYLEADIKTKRERLESFEKAPNKDDLDIIRRPEMVAEYDTWLENLMSTKTNYLKIDTSGKTIDAVLKEAFNHVNKKIQGA